MNNKAKRAAITSFHGRAQILPKIIWARFLEADDEGRNIYHRLVIGNKYDGLAAFIKAAQQTAHLDVKEILNRPDNLGRTPLHYAALGRSEAFRTLLVENGARWDVKDRDGLIPGDLLTESAVGFDWDF